MDVVPDRSALDADTIDVDPDTKDMLKMLGVDPPNVQVLRPPNVKCTLSVSVSHRALFSSLPLIKRVPRS